MYSCSVSIIELKAQIKFSFVYGVWGAKIMILSIKNLWKNIRPVVGERNLGQHEFYTWVFDDKQIFSQTSSRQSYNLW